MSTRLRLATLLAAMPLCASAQTPPTLEPPDLRRTPPAVRPPTQILGPIAPGILTASATARPMTGIVAPPEAAPAPRQGAIVSIVFGGLERAESFGIEGVTSDCGWIEPPRMGQRRRYDVSEGRSTVRREGTFETARDGGCRLSVTLRIKPSGLAPEAPLTLTTPPIALTGGRTVTMENTGALAERFRFAYATPAIGVCSGSSAGTLPGSPTHTVGLHATPASDIRLTVRSGPLGTYCHWRSETVELPTGVVLMEMHSRATASGTVALDGASGRRATCSVRGRGITAGDEILPRAGALTPPARATSPGTAPFPIGRLTSDRPEHRTVARAGYLPLLAADGTDLLGAMTFATIPLYAAAIAPLRLELECAATVTNDHYAELTIERLVFFVPDNVRFP